MIANGTDQNDAGPSRSHSHTPHRRNSDSQASASAHIRRTSSHHARSTYADGHDELSKSPSPRKSPRKRAPHLDIATFPTHQLLRLIAGLLQHIASSNDSLRPDHEHEQEQEQAAYEEGGEDRDAEGDSVVGTAGSSTRSRSQSRASHSSSTIVPPSSSPTTALFDHHPPAHPDADTPLSQPSTPSLNSSDFPLFTASRSSLSHPSSLLAFHARHIPSISIEAYLLRILKYCPTTNEVFLGLLVYFDRMTRLGTPFGVGGENAGVAKGKGFAIDSYNVHRLVIAGVTVASKFFSDVFYTNSRYAKVGGLPSTELNSLELQFLLLNDFRLRISLDEMQRYGDRLLAYAAEEEERERDRERDREREREESLAKESKESERHATAAGVPGVEDAHDASEASTQAQQAPAQENVERGESASQSGQGSESSANQSTITDTGASSSESQVPLSTVQPSQPALAPDHPSAPNSAPISRRPSQKSQSSIRNPEPTPTHSQSTLVQPATQSTGGAVTPSRSGEWEPHSSGAVAVGQGDGVHVPVPVSNGLRDWVRGDEVMG